MSARERIDPRPKTRFRTSLTLLMASSAVLFGASLLQAASGDFYGAAVSMVAFIIVMMALSTLLYIIEALRNLFGPPRPTIIEPEDSPKYEQLTLFPMDDK